MTPAVCLEHYEGPLDLLLDRVRQEELDIFDLPIAEITRQFLNYMDTAEQLDVNLGAEWFYIASLLIHIKSRSLLPHDPAANEPDPREELVRQLLDRDQLAGAAGFLEAQWACYGGWPAPPAPDAPVLTDGEDGVVVPGSISLLEVLQLAQKAVTSITASQTIALPSDPVAVEDMIHLLERVLEGAPRGAWLEFSQICAEQPSDQHRSAVFLALLELARRRPLDLDQPECFAPIRVRIAI